VRQDYNKYYKTVIPNLIGNLPYKKGDSHSLINRILNVTLDLIGENDTKTRLLHLSFRPARRNLLGTYSQIFHECTYSNSNVVGFSIKTYLSKHFKSILNICCHIHAHHELYICSISNVKLFTQPNLHAACLFYCLSQKPHI